MSIMFYAVLLNGIHENVESTVQLDLYGSLQRGVIIGYCPY